MKIEQFEQATREMPKWDLLRFFDKNGQEYRAIGTIHMMCLDDDELHVVIEPMESKNLEIQQQVELGNVRLFLE